VSSSGEGGGGERQAGARLGGGTPRPVDRARRARSGARPRRRFRTTGEGSRPELLGIPAGPGRRAARGQEPGARPEPHRFLPPGETRGEGPPVLSRGRPFRPPAARSPGPDRSPPRAGGGRGLSLRSRSAGLREAGGSAPRLAAPRGALGPSLARPGRLRRLGGKAGAGLSA